MVAIPSFHAVPKVNFICSLFSLEGFFTLWNLVHLVALWTQVSNGFKKLWFCGLPWWCSGWESACQCRRHGFEPWSGKIPHAAEQLGPWATITEPLRLEPVLLNKKGRNSERPAHRDEEWPPLATTRESPHTETKTQHSQKKKKNYDFVNYLAFSCS